jgi:hypothetical protein
MYCEICFAVVQCGSTSSHLISDGHKNAEAQLDFVEGEPDFIKTLFPLEEEVPQEGAYDVLDTDLLNLPDEFCLTASPDASSTVPLRVRSPDNGDRDHNATQEYTTPDISIIQLTSPAISTESAKHGQKKKEQTKCIIIPNVGPRAEGYLSPFWMTKE